MLTYHLWKPNLRLLERLGRVQMLPKVSAKKVAKSAETKAKKLKKP
jgi:hypothetical protein